MGETAGVRNLPKQVFLDFSFDLINAWIGGAGVLLETPVIVAVSRLISCLEQSANSKTSEMNTLRRFSIQG